MGNLFNRTELLIHYRIIIGMAYKPPICVSGSFDLITFPIKKMIQIVMSKFQVTPLCNLELIWQRKPMLTTIPINN